MRSKPSQAKACNKRPAECSALVSAGNSKGESHARSCSDRLTHGNGCGALQLSMKLAEMPEQKPPCLICTSFVALSEANQRAESPEELLFAASGALLTLLHVAHQRSTEAVLAEVCDFHQLVWVEVQATLLAGQQAFELMRKKHAPPG